MNQNEKMGSKSDRIYLFVGATSSMAQALERLWTDSGASFLLVARSSERLMTLAQDLESRGARSVKTISWDLKKIDTLPELKSKIEAEVPAIDVAVFAQGILNQDQKSSLAETMDVNFMSFAVLMETLSERMIQQKRGGFIAISSVAGDRGRASNYWYGTSKAALSAFCSGLRHRLYKFGIHVLTVKPGFVDTPMTAHLNKGGPLWATSEKVASDISKSWEKKQDVLYTPWFWRLIMMIIIHLPERIFKKTKL